MLARRGFAPQFPFIERHRIQPLRLFAETEREGLSIWQGVSRFGTDPAALTKDQRATLIQELRRYGNALTAIDFAGKGAIRSCDDALNAAK